ncbi:MAG: phosphoribosylformylglycinamidine synthase subunit PurQ [Gemmatimonadales bacterium]|nr:phosphoribosylformylglycinamidine synthase subunit PurQ [Gemmatimonadales bacterium]
MATRVAVIRFPGTNCDADTVRAVAAAGAEAFTVDHRETSLRGADAVILPGGFSYGDYLRSGAIARFSPVMQAVQAHAAAGGPLLGICNGFQVLCEAHLLPGALLRNAGLAFVARPVAVTVERTDTAFTGPFARGQRLVLPVAHGEGRFAASDETLRMLEAEGRVVLRYAQNPNGSAAGIAGICNAAGTVVGIMPHPERALDPLAGAADGAPFFAAVAALGSPA